MASPHVHGSQLPRCCDRGPLCLHLMARGSHRPLLTQGGRDVPSHPVGSHQLGRQRSPPLLPSAEHGAHKTAKMEQSGGQRHATKLCLQSSPAWTSVTTSSERAEARQPATSQLRRQESALGSSGRASGTHRCPEAPDGATGSEVLPDPGGGTEGAQNEAIPWAPETCWPPRDHRQPSQQSLRPRGDVGAVSAGMGKGRVHGLHPRNLVGCMDFKPWWPSRQQRCPTLRDPIDYSLPGSSIPGIFQARVLEWGAIAFSRGSSLPRD